MDNLQDNKRFGTEYSQELRFIQSAQQAGNMGKVRVCARRLVGFAVLHLFGSVYGKDALAILRNLQTVSFSAEINTLAESLLLGERDRIEGKLLNENPLETAQKIITLLERYHLNKFFSIEKPHDEI